MISMLSHLSSRIFFPHNIPAAFVPHNFQAMADQRGTDMAEIDKEQTDEEQMPALISSSEDEHTDQKQMPALIRSGEDDYNGKANGKGEGADGRGKGKDKWGRQVPRELRGVPHDWSPQKVAVRALGWPGGRGQGLRGTHLGRALDRFRLLSHCVCRKHRHNNE